MRKFITVIFFLFFALLFMFLLFIGELNFYVLTPAFIKDPLRETQTYRKLIMNADVLPDLMKGQEPGADAAAEQMPESAQKLTQAMLKSVDEKWLERESEKGIDAVFEYVTSEKKEIKLSIDLREFKSRLRTNLYPVLVEEYNKLPEVPVEQFDQQMAQNPGAFPTARPAGFTLEQMLAKTGLKPIEEIIKNIPDRYDSSYIDKNAPGAMDGLAGLKQLASYRSMVNIAFWIMLMLTVVLLLIFAKLTSKSWMEFLLRYGIYLSAFLIPLILFLISWFVVGNILLVEGLAQADLPVIVVREIVKPIVSYVINRVSMHLVVWSGCLSVVGLTTAISTQVIRIRKLR